MPLPVLLPKPQGASRDPLVEKGVLDDEPVGAVVQAAAGCFDQEADDDDGTVLFVF
jgi:hypothetical protein